MKTLLIIIVGFLISSAYAGGSAGFTEQVLPILEQDKAFADALLKSLEFNEPVWARTRLGSHTKFGGQRLGPYTVLAKPKGSQGSWTFEVTINTKRIFYDEDGNEIPLMDENGKKTGALFSPQLKRIAETFESLEIRPYKEIDSNPHVDATVNPSD